MNSTLFQGDLVRLCVEDPEVMTEAYVRWAEDSEYMRLLDSGPSYLYSKKQTQTFVENELTKEKPDAFAFMIRTLKDDRLIGDIGLDGVHWSQGDAFVGIGLGEREYWGKGYGTDAMRILLRYAFTELNLHRVTLNVFDYNPRAIRSYEKAGFVVEGRARQFLHREGRRWDLIYMGILRSEWEKIADSQ